MRGRLANRALISAGTGLGEAFLVLDGRDYVPYPSEGGHSDYAPRNEDEIDLLRFLRQKYNGRISFERVVSGQGLTNCYEFLREVQGPGGAGVAGRAHDARKIPTP